MTVEYSKQFVKAAKKLTGKYKESLINLIIEVKKADSVYSVSDCIKLTGYQNIYRIKMGDYRLVFILKIIENTAFFQLLVSRGEIYKKEHVNTLKKNDY